MTVGGIPAVLVAALWSDRLAADALAGVGRSLQRDYHAQVPCNRPGTGRPGSGGDRQFLRRFLRMGLAKLARAAITVHVMRARG